MSRLNLTLVIGALCVGIALGYFYAPKPATRDRETQVTRTVTKIRRVEVPGQTVTETIIVGEGRSTRERTKEAAKWHVSGGVATRFDRLPPTYEAAVERRVLGPFFVGAYAQTSGAVGVRLGMEF